MIFTFFKQLLFPEESTAPSRAAQAHAQTPSELPVSFGAHPQEQESPSQAQELRYQEISDQLLLSQKSLLLLKDQLSSALTRIGDLEAMLLAAQTHHRELQGLLEGYRAREARPIPGLPTLTEQERTPHVLTLLELLQRYKERVQILKDEIAVLKGLKPKPKLLPSRLLEETPQGSASQPDPAEEPTEDVAADKTPKKEAPSEEAAKEGEIDKAPKRKEKPKRLMGTYREKDLEIHEVIPIEPENLPPGSRYKDSVSFIVRGMLFQPLNIRYELKRYEAPDGSTLKGQLPPELNGEHVSQDLRALVLHLHHHGRMTQPLIHEMLTEYHFTLSLGQVNHLLTDDKESFHQEKKDILEAALEVSSYIHVDDTGARHDGRNGYCTHLGNELFAYFESTQSKSRLNFLEILRLQYKDYVLNEEALRYMKAHGLPMGVREKLAPFQGQVFADLAAWNEFLKQQGIGKGKHIQLATEGALMGSLHLHSDTLGVVFISDGARQFVLTLHGLCWVHADRLLAKLVGVDEEQKAAVEKVRVELWGYFQELKEYKKAPSQAQKEVLSARFEEIFGQKTCFTLLNDALRRLRKRKEELLIVLERPDLPLENNLSERDIREYVTRRKISGSTRSEEGRKCRDTFASLKKTCRKLGISFRQYLNDRLNQLHQIPPLAEIIRQRGHGKGNTGGMTKRSAA